MALHETGSNNPDGIEIKQHIDPRTGHPVDGIPFHPYYTVKDLFGATVFLLVFSVIVFYAPEFGGYFLEHNNFIPADPLKTPSHIAPVWYFTPYYSVLRATTDDLKWVIGIAVALFMVWALLPPPAESGADRLACRRVRPSWAALPARGESVGRDPDGCLGADLRGSCPGSTARAVKSIRYKGWIYKLALALFVVSFVVLGYLGMQTPTDTLTRIAQICTIIYFGFFLLMPWYTSVDKTTTPPERVT